MTDPPEHSDIHVRLPLAHNRRLQILAYTLVNRKLKCPLFRILKCPLVDIEMAVSVIMGISQTLSLVPVSPPGYVPTTRPVNTG